MRIREIVALVLLVLLVPPALAHAQRLPVRGAGRRGPAQPVPLSPVPAPIARAMVYRRLPISVESYPMISYVQAPGLNGAGNTSSWTSLGVGTRLEYRLTPLVSATVDLTSSIPGSPLLVHTAEIGARIGPERSERRLYPFVDMRAGYMSASNGGLAVAVDQVGGVATPGAYGARYSNGFGGVAGAGMEYAVTPTFSLTTAGSVMRSHLTSHDFMATPNVAPTFGMTQYRYTVGVKYNPVRRIVLPAASDLR